MPGIYAADGSMNVTVVSGGGGGGSVTVANQPSTTSTGALKPPTSGVGKIVETVVSLPAGANTQIIGANANRIAIEIQTDGTAEVGLSRTGAALTSAAASPLVVPTGSRPLYTMPVASLTAITAYTATAQTIRVTEYIS